MILTTLPTLFGERDRPVFRTATGAGPDLMRPSDPVNLIFLGDAEPLRIRTSLLALSANRDARWQVVAGRSARWRDAIGHLHTAFVQGQGWSVSAIQLELGRYKGARAHLRLFPFDGFTLGAAHVEFLPAGGFEHEVVSWELGEELVTSELRRAGLLTDAPSRIGPFETGLDRRISRDAMGTIPRGLADLAGLTGVPPTDREEVEIAGAGYLSAIHLSPLPVAEGERSWTRVCLDLATDIQNPLDVANPESLHIRGPIRLEQELVTGPDNLTVRMAVHGSVSVGGERIGQVSEGQIARLRKKSTRAALLSDYKILDEIGSPPMWSRRVRTRVTSGGEPTFRVGREG